ncbi:GDSL esterase/lipase At1g33811-like [Dioscorea cayenensis subsp. rotundata]|uniref:GDSL esterase/lipase At1g33811-like n=1 Tax=Dioscorea cayennensis subsp. rotundata TaxID=55577 RepID=A0AB40C481_DIOCR|nr:GDSL esterase/lipase At1g33811-like [Dioscorea cayenensis subsp. rotundata]
MQMKQMKMKSYFTGTILLFIIVSPSVAIVTPSPPPFFYVFGDSLFDVGNNNYLQYPAPKANFPFNGIDYPGNISTGRFGNGYIGPDYVAMFMGYPQSPPPYLSIINEYQTSRGINFASGGSGILNSTALYNSGARKIIVLGTAKTGCIPFIRSLLFPISGGCSEDLNNLSIQFKNETRALLQNLTPKLSGFRYVFIDTYEMDSLIRANAHQYGFTDLTNACCGIGRFNGQAPCTPISNLCSNRDNHYSWDPVHPTQAVARLVSNMSYYGLLHVFPMNIQQLVNA